MNEPNVSGVQGAGDAQETNRYAGIVSPDDAPKEAEKPVEEPKQEATQEAPEESDKVEDSEDEDEPVKKPKKGGFTRKLERMEAELAGLRAKQVTQPEKAEEVAIEPAGKPKLDDFEDVEAYYDALTDWKLDQREKKAEAKTKEDVFRREMQTKAEAYKAKAEEVAKQIPDYRQVVDESEVQLTNLMSQAILDSDMGPEVTYYLAKNPEQAKKAAKMGIVELNKFIGRIEERIESQKSQKVVRKQTNAPEPITPLGAGKTAKVWSLDDPNLPYEEYKKLRSAR